MDLVGFPDPQVLAQDMASQGHYSCAEAEAAGWIITNHLPTRQAVDQLLVQLRGIVTTTPGSSPQGPASPAEA